eukprot:813023-Pyramimonas_sp.AAC.1
MPRGGGALFALLPQVGCSGCPSAEGKVSCVGADGPIGPSLHVGLPVAHPFRSDTRPGFRCLPVA